MGINVGALLTYLVSLVLQLIGLQSQIQANTNQNAKETTTYLIQDTTHAIEQTVDSITYGNNALHLQLNAIQAAIAALTPVTLPTTPPAGYGGPSSSDVATAVWNYTSGLEPGTTFAQLEQAGKFALQSSGYRMKASADVKFSFTGPFYKEGDPQLPADVPTADIANILPSDDLLSWLNRETGFSPWTLSSDGSGLYRMPVPGNGDFIMWCDATTEDFNRWKAFVLGEQPRAGAPVWPGVANVSIGSSAALIDGLEVLGPLDGVIVTITSVPYPISFYPFGTLKSFVKAGAITFVDDNGQAEMAQNLGFETNIITPRMMARADHAIIRLKSGVVGTIAPWTIV